MKSRVKLLFEVGPLDDVESVTLNSAAANLKAVTRVGSSPCLVLIKESED